MCARRGARAARFGVVVAVVVVAEHVTIELAGAEEAGRLANWLELYIHDLSEVFAVEPGVDGRFGYVALPLYWSEPEKRLPFLIRAEGKPVGFALVTRGSPVSHDPDVWDVAEFFILRRYRRSGYGKRAAALLFEHLPGRWLVRVSESNRGAVPFWESAIGDYTRGSFTQSKREASPHVWRDFAFSAPVGGAG